MACSNEWHTHTHTLLKSHLAVLFDFILGMMMKALQCTCYWDLSRVQQVLKSALLRFSLVLVHVRMYMHNCHLNY